MYFRCVKFERVVDLLFFRNGRIPEEEEEVEQTVTDCDRLHGE